MAINKLPINPEQQKIIDHLDGPILVIAGPGSGKTFTLVERIIKLVQEKKVKPENLLVVTFTEKAARELKTRISNRLFEDGIQFNLNEMYLGTIHSVCLKILEEYREYTRLGRNYSLLDQFDQQYFIFQRLKLFREITGFSDVVPNPISSWEKSNSIMKWVNKISEEDLDISKWEDSGDVELAAWSRIYKFYHKLLEEENSLDFSTIQLEALRLLTKNPEVLEELQDHLKYLMIDEYQDTNTIQEKIFFTLAGNNKNICVVGDDDQGLYRFRGASVRNILQFKDSVGGECKEVKLTTNYRSHPDIINFYNHWQNDQDWEHKGENLRFNKLIVPNQAKKFEEIKTVFKVGASEGQDWNEEVLKFLLNLKSSGALTDWNQVAFLFRSVRHHSVLNLAQFLETNNIPVYSPRSNLFFERDEIKLMIGALIFLFPQFPKIREIKINDQEVTLEVWKYYDNECFKLFTEELRKPENNDLLVWIRIKAKNHLRLTSDTDYGFARLFYMLLEFPLFSKYLDEEDKSMSRAQRNLAIFSQLIGKFEYYHGINNVLNPKFIDRNIKSFFNNFLRFLVEGGINEYEDDSEYAPSGCISFMTIHQSKGLEFPVVIVDSLWSSPIKQYTELDEKIERDFSDREAFEPIEKTKYYDFWRLYYTAFSRAQNLLILTCKEQSGTKPTPSKWFKKFYDPLPSWSSSEFQPLKLALAKVKEINIKNEYSFTSHINVFETCAQQYRFFKEMEFAPVKVAPRIFGTLVHQTIEDIHRSILDGSDEELTVKQIEEWFERNYKVITKTERVLLAPGTKKSALEHVIRYFEREHPYFNRVKETEIEVALVKDNYILKGTIDLVVGENNSVEIIDFKAETKPDIHTEQYRITNYQKQLEVYAHLLEEKNKLTVSKMHLYYTGEKDGIPTISFNKVQGSIDNTIKVFDRIVNRIESKDFKIQKMPAKECISCDMKFYCNKNWKFKG